MAAHTFDDARLEAPELAQDAHLRHLAEAGARIRRAALAQPVGRLERADRPRGILALGAEARLVRAVLEPVCPVPFMAWPGPMLPAWVGPLDLVVVLGDRQASEWELQCAAEAARRGATLIVAAPEQSPLAAAAKSSTTTLIPAPPGDPMAAAIAILALLGELELGPCVIPDHVADAADLVAEECSPVREIGSNPGKDLAMGLADGVPLIWGGSVLASRASRRIAEALRRASGRPALAADADEIETILRGLPPRDPFADPFEDSADPHPVLVVLDDDKVPDRLASTADDLHAVAEQLGVRVCRITSGDAGIDSGDVESYVTLLQHGRYGAAYLGIALNGELR